MEFASLALVCLAAAVVTAVPLAAQPTPLDPVEFQVNTYTTANQVVPAATVDANGGFVVVWASGGSFGNDSSSFSVQARRFAADGSPLDPAEFQVNTYTTGWQWIPAVAADPWGQFVVVWESDSSLGNDSSGWSIQARRFAADGSPLDPAEFQVNTYTTGYQVNPVVGVDTKGNFVVVWQSDGSAGGDTSELSIQARRFATDGSALDPTEFQVNTYTSSFQVGPALAVAADGDFVVAWESDGSAEGDSSYDSAQARRYAADGSPLDLAEFQVNTYTTSLQNSPAVAATPAGDFVVVWKTYGWSAGGDTSSASIQARRYAASGSALDPAEFQVNGYTTDAQRWPTVAVDSEGNFVVAWDSFGSAGSDSSSFSVQSRRFRSDGVAIDATDFQVNSYTTNFQEWPAVAAAPSGNFVVAWQSQGSPSGDSAGYSIQARRFGRPTIPVTSTSGGTGGPDCKLRDAITAANTGFPAGGCTAGNEGAVITLPAGATVTLTAPDNGTNGLPIVEKPITIRGNGATIARSGGCPGASDFRHFEVADGAILTLEDLTLEGGCASGSHGGAILGFGTLLLREATVENSTADGSGGGIYAEGPFYASDSTVAGNSGTTGGGLAILDLSPLALVSRSTFSGNTADTGGGIAAEGLAFLRQTTLSGNTAISSAGGLYVGSLGELAADFTTVTDNTAPMGAGLQALGRTELGRVLVGDNSGGNDCSAIVGPIVAYGENLDTDGSCAAFAGGNFTWVPALLLDTLADNGGSTWTHLPLNGSPARDAATVCETGSGAAVIADQRGLPRPTDDDLSDTAECDLGAVEVNTIFADGFELGDWTRWSAAVP